MRPGQLNEDAVLFLKRKSGVVSRQPLGAGQPPFGVRRYPTAVAAARRLAFSAGVAFGLSLAALPASAQGSMAQCRAELPPPAAARQRACDEHGACRAVARIIDSCPALLTFLEMLAGNGSKVDDSALRRTLIEAGVPPPGLPSCTTEFNRALCRNFLNLEDASGGSAAGPSRTAQFQAGLRRLVEQQESARVPADAHRLAELKLEACALARPGSEREAPCREAIEAVQACGLFRDEWAQRREVLRIDAQRLGQSAALETLRSLDLPPCAQTLPGSALTPRQALPASAEAGDAGAAPPPQAPAPPTPAAAPAAAAPPLSTTARADNNNGTDCKTALRRMEERFEVINRRRPAGAERLAAQQVEIFMLTEQMGLLERQCRGQREYDFLRPTRERLARALQTCRDSAANPVNDCVPRVAW